MVDADGLKLCPRCGERKLAAGHFYRVNRTDCDGYAGYCKECTKAAVVAWQKANPSKKAASDHKQNAKPERKIRRNNYAKRKRREDPDWRAADAARGVAWRQDNPTKARAAAERFRHNNPEGFAKAQAKYHASDAYKAIHAERERLRRAVRRCRGEPGKIDLDTWRRILDAFGHQCCYCDTGVG